MSATYELWYTDDAGNHIELLDNVISFDYVLVVGDIGVGSFRLPYDSNRVYVHPHPDRRVHIWRHTPGGGQRLECVCFVRRWEFATDDAGTTTLTLTSVDQHDLLRRRIVAYYSASAQALMTDNAGDIMKEVVRDNLGVDSVTDYDGAAVSGRDMSSLGLTVAGNLGDGPSITAEFAWKSVLATLQDLQAASRAEGTEVYFLLYANTPVAFVFETRTGQPGRDRSWATGYDPLVFGMDYGNVRNPTLVYDYLDEINFVYAGGEGQDGNRNIQEVSDTGRINASIWNRSEAFAPASGSNDNNAIVTAGNAALSSGAPRTTFTADLLDTEQTPYGGRSGWGVGDKVTVSHLGRQLDVIIHSVAVAVSESGEEAIAGRTEWTG